MFGEWYRKREKSDEREENFDKTLRGERRIQTKERAAGDRIENMAREESETHEGGLLLSY